MGNKQAKSVQVKVASSNPQELAPVVSADLVAVVDAINVALADVGTEEPEEVIVVSKAAETNFTQAYTSSATVAVLEEAEVKEADAPDVGKFGPEVVNALYSIIHDRAKANVIIAQSTTIEDLYNTLAQSFVEARALAELIKNKHHELVKRIDALYTIACYNRNAADPALKFPEAKRAGLQEKITHVIEAEPELVAWFLMLQNYTEPTVDIYELLMAADSDGTARSDAIRKLKEELEFCTLAEQIKSMGVPSYDLAYEIIASSGFHPLLVLNYVIDNFMA
jgi:hypothetical protein